MLEEVKARGGSGTAPAGKRLDDLYALIDGIEVAMMTTRRPDGQLVSRAMRTQRRAEGADLWFVTNIESHKLDELAADPHVNVAYCRSGTGEWVSVSGTAQGSQDRDQIRELYREEWKAWIPPESGARDGGPEDPRIALIFVEAHSVMYAKRGQPSPVALFDTAGA
jgi:general stress protein 26